MHKLLARSVVVTMLVATPVLGSSRAASADRTTDLAAQAVCTVLAMGTQDCGPFTR